MGANKPDVDNPVRVVNPNDDSILIAADIENDTPVLKDAGAAELCLHLPAESNAIRRQFPPDLSVQVRRE